MWYLPFRFFKFDRFVNEIPDFSCSIFSRNTVPAQTGRFPLCICKKVTFLGSQAEIPSPLVTPKMSLFCRYKGGITIFLGLRCFWKRCCKSYWPFWRAIPLCICEKVTVLESKVDSGSQLGTFGGRAASLEGVFEGVWGTCSIFGGRF